MTRATLLLLLSSTAALVTGCTCNQNDVAIYWQFQNQAGAIGGCQLAGVTTIAIYVDGNNEWTGACAQPNQGITLTNFARNAPYQFEVVGLDASGNQIYGDAFTYVSNVCGLDKRTSTLVSTAGDMSLAYSFDPPADCSAPTANSLYRKTYIWFELLDQGGQVYASVGPSQNPEDEIALPCGAGNATILVPAALYGQYTVSRMQEVDIQRDGSIVVFHARCSASPPLQHAQPGDVFTLPPMPALPTGSTYSCW